MTNTKNKNKIYRMSEDDLLYCDNCEKETKRIYIGKDRVCAECREVK
jgi:hypothetical protein